MSKKRGIKGITLGNLALFLIAGALLLGSGIGSARAALTYFSNTYTSQLEMKNIGVTLLENDAYIAWRDYDKQDANGQWSTTDQPVENRLLQNLLARDDDGNIIENFKMGRVYPEALAVRNSGTIDEYLRVHVFRYWVNVDEDGNETKNLDLDPNMIDLGLVNENCWILDPDSVTPERFTLYYNKILPVGEITEPFSDTLTVNGEVLLHKDQQISTTDDGYTVITSTYDYEGVEFRLEVEVNAVQTHNAADAILSSWGKEVSIAADKTLQLKQK